LFFALNSAFYFNFSVSCCVKSYDISKSAIWFFIIRSFVEIRPLLFVVERKRWRTCLCWHLYFLTKKEDSL